MGHTQKALADIVSKELKLQRDTGRQFLERVIDLIADDIVYTGRIELRGLGAFTVGVRPPVHTNHPATGNPVTVPSKKVVRFRTSSQIRSRLNPKRSKKAAQKQKNPARKPR